MLWLKAVHLISMVTWFAALFYLPRLFVYHAMSDDQISIDRFKVMERKLYRGIMTPSAIVTCVFGAWMLMDYAWAAYGQMIWLHIKLALIISLIAYHIYCGYLVKTFARDDNKHSHVFYRFFNEIPVFMLLGIIFLATLKPA